MCSLEESDAPSRPKRSLVWRYFQDKKGIAVCKLCTKVITLKYGNTTNLTSHLLHKHSKEYYELMNEKRGMERSISSSSLTDGSVADESNPQRIEIYATQPSTSTATLPAAISTTFQAKQKSCQIKLDRFKVLDKKTTERFTNSVTKFISMDMMPYSIVENEGFKQMIRELQPNYVLPSRKTFAENKVPRLYSDVRAKAVLILKEKDFVALTTDCWTSTVMDPYITVTIHFINSNTWEMSRLCLACRKLDADHTAEILRDSLLDILSEWNINVDKISGCTTDNASNILKCMRLLKWNHISCFGHTLNIGINKVFKSDHIKDAIKKARSMQNSIAHSWQLKRNLRDIQRRLNLSERNIPSVCETRWWSVLRMLKVIVDQHVALVTLFTETEKSKYRNYSLTANEVHLLTRVIDVVEPLEALCEHLCGETFVTSSTIWPVVTKLKDILNEGCISTSEEVDLDSDTDNLNNDEANLLDDIKSIILSPLQERYEKPEVQNLLMKATFLDPRFKLEYATRREFVIDMIKSEACDITTAHDGSLIDNSYVENSVPVARVKLTGLAAILKPRSRSPKEVLTKEKMIADEVEAYIKTSLIDMNENPLLWWRSHAADFPSLSVLARKYLCIPGSSVPSERVFSCSGNIVTDTRSCLTPEHVDQLVFLALNKHIM